MLALEFPAHIRMTQVHFHTALSHCRGNAGTSQLRAPAPRPPPCGASLIHCPVGCGRPACLCCCTWSGCLLDQQREVNGLFPLDFMYLFLERGKGREREKHQCVVASRAPPTGDLARNPGLCPYWELNGNPLVCRLALNPLSHAT